VALSSGGGTTFLPNLSGYFRGPGHVGYNEGRLTYHFYNQNQSCAAQLANTTLGWDSAGWPVAGGSIPSQLVNALMLGNGSFQFGFTNVPGVSFTVLTATNIASPPSNWTLLGRPTELSPGQFQFTDPGATNKPQGFYRVRNP
jgi:hypothetical protein